MRSESETSLEVLTIRLPITWQYDDTLGKETAWVGRYKEHVFCGGSKGEVIRKFEDYFNGFGL